MPTWPSLGTKRGEGGSSYSRLSTLLTRESMDCDEGSRGRGGGTRLNIGEVEFGWLRYWLSRKVLARGEVFGLSL